MGVRGWWEVGAKEERAVGKRLVVVREVGGMRGSWMGLEGQNEEPKLRGATP